MLDLLSSKNVLTQVVGVIFALLAALHVGLPASFTAPAVVAAALLVIAVVAAVTRFGVPGSGPTDAKLWWQSKTIWTQIVAAVVAVAAIVGAKLQVDQGSAVAFIMVVIGIVNVVLHKTSTSTIVATAS